MITQCNGCQVDRDTLINDLHIAFLDAARHKHNRTYVKYFKKHLQKSIEEIADAIINRTYKPEPSYCFIINHPKKREVFAAKFRDRVVHHLYFNYVHQLFENTFIQDNYSCIKGRGTGYGIKRFVKHICRVSENYTKPCYILQMDIKGYFMHIDRQLVCDIALRSLDKMKDHYISKHSNGFKWGNVLDYDMLRFLTTTIALHNPMVDCEFRCDKSEWIGLPKSKSLFHVEDGKGLPIGNLTSQLFSNVYLNKLDQFVKRVLKCEHYGRYVDDFYVVHESKEFLHSIIPQIEEFLRNELGLEIHKGKTKITDIKHGVTFLGAFVKPNRIYISNKSLNRIKRQIHEWNYYQADEKNPSNSINSFLGSLRQYSSFNIRKQMFDEVPNLKKYGVFNKDYTKFIDYEHMKIKTNGYVKE